MSSPVETMVSGLYERVMHNISSPVARGSIEAVEAIFGRQNWNAFTAISNPAYNSAIGQTVVSMIYGVIPDYLRSAGGKAAQRKFHLESQSTYDKIYCLPKGKEEYPALPPSAQLIAYGETHCVAGYAGDEAVELLGDVYFSADPAEAEAFFGLEENRGLHSTYYALTYRKATKEVVRTKVYKYDDAFGAGDWEQALSIALTTENAA